MTKPVLYSTNIYLKLHIQEKYRGDVHYVWCSEHFDSSTLSRYSPGAIVARSSNPADIYKELLEDVRTSDVHSLKIKEQRASLIKRAVDWYNASEITKADHDDIIYIAKKATFDMWRPLIYVIPRGPVEPRMQIVPASKRAGLGAEFIIPDLNRSEFDIIEL